MMKYLSNKKLGWGLLAMLLMSFAAKLAKDNRAQRYLINCKRVEPGMTVKQAENIMGDEEGSDHSIGRGELTYITPPFARTGTTIYFNPDSEIVTEVICGDSKWSRF